MMTGRQRAYLRSLVNNLEPIIQVGKGGISGNLIRQVDEALESRELIKVSVLDSCDSDTKEISRDVAGRVNAEVVQVIGRKFSLYRRARKPQIILPY